MAVGNSGVCMVGPDGSITYYQPDENKFHKKPLFSSFSPAMRCLYIKLTEFREPEIFENLLCIEYFQEQKTFMDDKSASTIPFSPMLFDEESREPSIKVTQTRALQK